MKPSATTRLASATGTTRGGKRDPAAAIALGLVGFLVGLVFGLVIGLSARRPARVLCTSALHIESAGPGEWSIRCEGGH